MPPKSYDRNMILLQEGPDTTSQSDDQPTTDTIPRHDLFKQQT